MTVEKAQKILKAHSVETRLFKGELQALECATLNVNGLRRSVEQWVTVELNRVWLFTWLGY